MFAGPASLLEWLLAVSGAAVFLVFTMGLRAFAAPERRATRSSAFGYETAVACALIHAVGILSRRSPADGWAAAGIFLYLLSMVIFLDTIERTRHTVISGPVVATALGPDHDRSQRQVTRRINLAFAVAWVAGPVATHSLTLLATAIIMIAWQLRGGRLR